MNIWNSFTAVAALSASVLLLEGCPPVRAEQAPAGTAALPAHAMDMGDGSPNNPTTSDTARSKEAQAKLEAIKKLVGGKWEAPMSDGKTIVDTFQPFALGTAILAEEWVDGQQITSTVFYIVGSELRADHYCDYLNQPRYVAKPSTDASIIDLEFREATNLDTHPKHFHSTTWHLIDANHMTQDWVVEGGANGHSAFRLEFVRQQ
jgi:hypothetical protein